MKELDIRVVRTGKELAHVFRIREQVFVREQNVASERERDEFDRSSQHVLVRYRNGPVGCARIRFIDRSAKLERVAVLMTCRNKGVGARLVDFLIDYYIKNGAMEIFLHAQCNVIKFYRKWGFEPRGEPFMGEGIRHEEMYLNVKQSHPVS
jgi:predicted GNAT family N-acyltransferase